MRAVAIVAVPDVLALDVTCPVEVFALANRWLPEQERYQVALLAPRAGPLPAFGGLSLLAERSLADPLDGELDTLVVAGGEGVFDVLGSAPLVAAVGRLAGRARRVAGICTGAFLLGAAGLLAGRRVTTHRNRCDELAERWPDALVEREVLFICDDSIATTAGRTAGVDLALSFVEEDHGRAFAVRVGRELADFLVAHGRVRSGGPPPRPDDAGLPALLHWIIGNAPILEACNTGGRGPLKVRGRP